MTGVKPAMTQADSMDTDWPRVALLMLCGVFVATQVGKLPPAMPGLREHFGASLVQLGWISSVFNLVAALVALATGLVADRVGRRTMLKLGLLALGIGALLGASSGGIGWLLVSRVMEGLGFVGIVVAAPALMREAAGLSRQPLVLGLWSSYMALGMTAMLLAAPWLIGLMGWRGGWWTGVMGSALLLLLVLRVFPGSRRASAAPQAASGLLHGLRVATPWLLAGCFAIYTLQWMAMMVWLPTFLHDEFQLGLGQATVIVAVVIVANAPGNWLGGYLSQRGLAPAHLILASGLVMGVTGWAAFAADLDPALRFALCVVFSFIGGVLPASIYACVPAVAARRQNFASVNGLVVQASNIGALLGPPLAAALVVSSGWRGVGPVYLMTAAVSALLIVLAARAPEMRPTASARRVHG
jgi:MFS family permease